MLCSALLCGVGRETPQCGCLLQGLNRVGPQTIGSQLPMDPRTLSLPSPDKMRFCCWCLNNVVALALTHTHTHERAHMHVYIHTHTHLLSVHICIRVILRQWPLQELPLPSLVSLCSLVFTRSNLNPEWKHCFAFVRRKFRTSICSLLPLNIF